MARIVLVHGAFSDARVWERVLPGLRAAGHEVTTFDLPGSGADPTPVAEVTLERYAARVCDVLREGEPAVLVGHSMGGVVVTQAAARCPEQVARLVYVCAFAPREGESLVALTHLPEAAGDAVQENMVVDGEPPVATLPPAAAREGLMACCDAEGAAWGIAQMGPQPVLPFTEPVHVGAEQAAAFASVPKAYVMCLQDRAVRPALQRLMAQATGCREVIELDTDHMPMISRTDELIGALDRLAAAASPAAAPH